MIVYIIFLTVASVVLFKFLNDFLAGIESEWARQSIWILAYGTYAIVYVIFPFFAVFVVRRFISLKIYEDRVELENNFLTKKIKRIEGSKIESVSFSESMLGRGLYGQLLITGTGSAQIKIMIEHPEKAVEIIRKISSAAATKTSEFSTSKESTNSSLAQLIEMKEKGHLTEEEFGLAKRKLLES